MPNNNIEIYDEVKYEQERVAIDLMFPDCPFDICFSLDELNQIVSRKNRIMLIHNNMTCICCGDVPLYKTRNQKSCGIWVNASNTQVGVSNLDCIKALYKIHWKPTCNHRFVELFWHIKDNLYEVGCGS